MPARERPRETTRDDAQGSFEAAPARSERLLFAISVVALFVIALVVVVFALR